MAKHFLLFPLILVANSAYSDQKLFTRMHCPASHIRTFNLKQPEPIQAEDLKISAENRIAHTFIGTIPHDIQSIIHYFAQKQTATKPLAQYDAILLSGDPGTGKNFLIETISKELQIPYLYTNGTSFLSMYHGITSLNIQNFFKVAQQADHPVLIFIDYADMLLMDEKYITTLMYDETSAAPEQRKARQTLCEEIRNISQNPNVFVFLTELDEQKISKDVSEQLDIKKVTVEKIKKKEDFIAFFKKSLRDNGFTSESEIEKLAPTIAHELKGWNRWASISMSSRELSHIVPAALARKHTDKFLNKKEEQDFMLYVSQIIQEFREAF